MPTAHCPLPYTHFTHCPTCTPIITPLHQPSIMCCVNILHAPPKLLITFIHMSQALPCVLLTFAFACPSCPYSPFIPPHALHYSYIRHSHFIMFLHGQCMTMYNHVIFISLYTYVSYPMQAFVFFTTHSLSVFSLISNPPPSNPPTRFHHL